MKCQVNRAIDIKTIKLDQSGAYVYLEALESCDAIKKGDVVFRDYDGAIHIVGGESAPDAYPMPSEDINKLLCRPLEKGDSFTVTIEEDITGE